MSDQCQILLEDAAAEIEAILERTAQDRRRELLLAAADCEAIFARRVSEIRDEARARLQIGDPPPLRHLFGRPDREVPMNKVLGWMLDPALRGAPARRGLLKLAVALDYPALRDDIERGMPLTVWPETSPDLEITSRKPDLTIESPNATLLIENKVGAPESGPDQYAHYLETLRRLAGAREHRAYLLVPDERNVPPGWSGQLTHRELASALRPLTQDDALPFWDRVVYGLIVSDLDPDETLDRIQQIERLLEGGRARSDVDVATRLTQLLRRPTINPMNGGR